MTVTRIPLESPTYRAPELHARDGRVFHIGDAVWFHVQTAPLYPLHQARVAAIVQSPDREPILVLDIDDDAGVRLPDPSTVHHDAEPLAGCRWCAARES